MATESEVVRLCSDMIRIDTSNDGSDDGPGERVAAEHVAGLLDEVGIAAEIWEGRPGRANVLARWGGDQGSPLLVHGHLDVVPAVAADWQLDPFSGEVVDGVVWGRGAVDMKDFNAMVLATIRARTREGRVPRRPILVCFTADEEAGGLKGAAELVRHKRDFFDGVTEAVGEVGGFSVTVRDRRFYLIEAAEKGMAWMRLTADGTAGHGSMRHPDNVVTRLAGAVARIGQHQWPIQLTDTMQVLLAAVGEYVGVDATPDNAEELITEFGPAARMLGAVLQDTTNPTMLNAGYKVNVVPGQATGHIDGRFLPGHREQFLDTLTELAGPGVRLDEVSVQDALEHRFEGDLAEAITASLLGEDPGAVVAPYLMSGGTDAKHWAALGIRSFGFAPLRLPPDLDFTGLFHGVDERVPVESLEFGARVFDRFFDLI